MARIYARDSDMAPTVRGNGRQTGSLADRTPAAAPAAESARSSNLGEVIVEGRRYRLVPVDQPPAGGGFDTAVGHLTARELQIAALVADGRVNKEIAAELCISEWTVSTHLRRIFAKLGVDRRAAMVSKCLLALRR